MKLELLAVAFLLMASCRAKAQIPATDPVIAKPKIFVIKLHAVNKSSYGFLSGMDDSTIKISFKRTTFSDAVIEKPSDNSYLYSELEKVGVRKYGTVRKGILYFGLLGAGIGSLLQLAGPVIDFGGTFGGASVTSSPGPYKLTGLISGLITGVIIGELVGSKMLKFNIHRNKEKFREMKSSILEMTLSKPKDSSYTFYEPASFN